jgi:hypothetical protein
VGLLTVPGGVYGFGTGCVHHRKRQSFTSAAGRRVHAYLHLARIQMGILVHGVNEQPKNAFFRVPLSAIDTARDAAAEMRARWEAPHGPVDSMVEVLERASGIVIRRRTPSTGLGRRQPVAGRRASGVPT